MSAEIIGLIVGITTGAIGLISATIKYYFHYKEAQLRHRRNQETQATQTTLSNSSTSLSTLSSPKTK